MSNKRIRIKNAKLKKKKIILDQSFETAKLIIKLNMSNNLAEKLSIGAKLYIMRMKQVEQIRTINEIIKYGKRQMKGCRIVSSNENILKVKLSGEDK